MADNWRMSLREAVTSKKEAVWELRKEEDIYTRRGKRDTLHQEVDHILEIALVEHSTAVACLSLGATMTGFAYKQACQYLKKMMNEEQNLNVTSRSVNRKKWVPFKLGRARANQPGGYNLRQKSFEQIAREGKSTRELVEDGTWSRVETSVVTSWDSMKEKMEEDASSEQILHRDSINIILQTRDDLESLFEKCKLY
jgi:hypothetical protein